MAFDYRSKTHWPSWDAPGSQISAALPGEFRIDVSARKSLWDGRFWATMRVEDLLDADRPSHPFGPSPGLRLHVQAAASLGSG